MQTSSVVPPLQRWSRSGQQTALQLYDGRIRRRCSSRALFLHGAHVLATHTPRTACYRDRGPCYSAANHAFCFASGHGTHTGTVPVTQLHTTLQAGHPVSAGWLHSLLVLLCLSSHVGFCLSYAPSLWSLAHSLCCVVLCIFSSPLCVRAGRAACLPRCAPRCGCQGR